MGDSSFCFLICIEYDIHWSRYIFMFFFSCSYSFIFFFFWTSRFLWMNWLRKVYVELLLHFHSIAVASISFIQFFQKRHCSLYSAFHIYWSTRKYLPHGFEICASEMYCNVFRNPQDKARGHAGDRLFGFCCGGKLNILSWVLHQGLGFLSSQVHLHAPWEYKHWDCENDLK